VPADSLDASPDGDGAGDGVGLGAGVVGAGGGGVVGRGVLLVALLAGAADEVVGSPVPVAEPLGS
jgi:hypothetical protein